jgi:hypothetical protein
MTSRLDDAPAGAAGGAGLRPLQIEANGINVIADAGRKGRPRSLFWPWFAANVSVLRRHAYAEADLYTPAGRYGDVRPLPVAVVVVATAPGCGLVTNTAAHRLTWQG